MNVLLTGASGFLGKYILNSIKKNSNYKTLGRTYSDYLFDISTSVPKFKEQFDLIIHNAGKAHFIPKSEFEKKIFYDVNVQGTINLLEGLAKSYIPRYFIFISSVSVYGITKGHLIDETTPLLATDSYGLSKIQAEITVSDWCKKHNVKCTILRLPLVVGANPPGNLGSMIRGIKKGYYFNIAGGKAKKSMVLANDVSQIILQVAEKGGIYNLTDGINPTFFELSTILASRFKKKKILNLPLIFAKFLALIGDIVGNKFPLNSDKLSKITSTLTFDDSKARLSFGWNPNKVLDNINT